MDDKVFASVRMTDAIRLEQPAFASVKTTNAMTLGYGKKSRSPRLMVIGLLLLASAALLLLVAK